MILNGLITNQYNIHNMNYKLIIFISILIFVWYHYQNNNTNKLKEIKTKYVDWLEITKKYKKYNEKTYYRFSRYLKLFDQILDNVNKIKLSKIETKDILPDVINKTLNTFHSMVHSLPYDVMPQFDEVLVNLRDDLYNKASQTVYNFYRKDPTSTIPELRYWINEHMDWFIHNKYLPKDNDPYFNSKYEYFV